MASWRGKFNFARKVSPYLEDFIRTRKLNGVFEYKFSERWSKQFFLGGGSVDMTGT